nr:MAG TPA: hypothetical protein [Caudoviricetes sp.]
MINGRDHYFRLIHSECQVSSGTGADITAARIICKGE